MRYIWESYLDALCHEASWNAEGGSKCKIGHFRGSCFSVSVFRVSVRKWHSFEQTLWLFRRKQRYSRMDKKRSYADVVSGSGKFIVLCSFFYGDLEIFHHYTCDIWLTTCGYTPHQGLPTPMKDWWSGGWLCNLLYTGCSCPGWK